MSKQLLRSGTAIGALIKLHISLKEANETDYWLTLLHESDYINDIAFQSIQADCTELIKLLTSIIKSSKCNPNASTIINY